MLAFAAGLEISTSRTALVSEANPHWQRYMDFAREFGIPEDLVVVIDSEDPTAVRRFMDGVATAVAAENDLAQSVFHRVDLNAFEKRGLLFLDDEDLSRIDRLASMPALQELLKEQNAAARIQALSALLEGAPSIIGSDAEPRQTELMAMTLGRLVDEMRAFALEDRRGALTLIDRSAAANAAMSGRGAPGGVDAEGYMTIREGKTGVVFIRPGYTRDDMTVVLPFVARVRQICERVARDIPGVTFGLTGIPGTQRDEFFAIQRDTVLTSVVALGGVALLFLLFLPTLRLLVYAMVPVAFGVIWTAASIRLLFGYVNLMSSVFLVVLIGMGIDFSVHLASRFLEGRRRKLSTEEAVRQAVLHSGRGVMTGAITSAGAFAAVGWCGFQGIEQLGIAAGVGLILTLGAALTVFPATLVLTGSKI
ncbi:MAG: MMPL family transporter, partial [Myxococcota bacterium]